MMKDSKREKSLSTVAALLLFAVFAVGVLAVLLGGARIYSRLTQRDEETYGSRTCAQYVMTKLRQAESPEAIGLVRFGDGDALEITQKIEGEAFVTRIYCHEGWLMELYTVSGGEFAPEDGERILPASGLAISREDALLNMTVTDGSGKAQKLFYALSGEEVRP